MRDLFALDANRDWAWERRTGGPGDSGNGCFKFRSPEGGVLRCMVSDGMGWDHVSVSVSNRCPTWAEMEFIKRQFFRDDETAMQLHVPPSDHVNCHPYCLHLWRPHSAEIPRPPSMMVGPSEAEAS